MDSANCLSPVSCPTPVTSDESATSKGLKVTTAEASIDPEINDSTEAAAAPKPTSPAKVLANRKNAKRSTGPRTLAGKIRSAQNSSKHGVYATKIAAVAFGPYREDPEEIDAYLKAISDALDPRDPLETGIAAELAHAYLRQRRLAAWENGLLAGGNEIGNHTKATERLRNHGAAHEALCEWSRIVTAGSGPKDGGSETDFPWEDMVNHLRKILEMDTGKVDPWVDGVEPADPEEWRETLVEMVAGCFPTSAELWETLDKWAEAVEQLMSEHDEKARPAVARESIATIEDCLVVRTRMTSEMIKLLATYGLLKERYLGEE